MWTAVPGWPGVEVSEFGRVRVNGKSRKQHPSDNGYVYCNIKRNGRWRTVAVHVLMCRTFHGRRPTARHQVAHRDGNKRHNIPKNIRWATPKENAKDTIRLGRTTRGEKQHRSKLTRELVRWARKAKAKGAKITTMATVLGVTKSCLGKAISGKNWGWVK